MDNGDSEYDTDTDTDNDADNGGRSIVGGDDWFQIPHDDDPDGETKWGQVFDKMGRPKDHKEYKWQFDDHPEIKLDDQDKDYRAQMARVFHRAGLTQRQVAELEQGQFEQLKLMRDAQTAKHRSATERSRMILRDEWGASELEPKIGKANSLLVRYAGEDAKSIVSIRGEDGTPLGSNPQFIKMMARIADDMGTAPAAGSRDDAKLQIERIEKRAIKAGISPASREWPHKELEPLYRQVHGSKNRGPQPFMRGSGGD